MSQEMLQDFLEKERKRQHARSRFEELRSKELDPLMAHTGMGREMPYQLPGIREWFIDLLAYALRDPFNKHLGFFAMRKIIACERVMGRYAAMADMMFEDDLRHDWPVIVTEGGKDDVDFSQDTTETEAT